jgi:hypothetical protein
VGVWYFLEAFVTIEHPRGFISVLNTNCTVAEGDAVKRLAYLDS